jgi:hypothetical protein
MTLQEALTILTTFHAWRIGDDEVDMQKPSEVTKALKTLLDYHIPDVGKMVYRVTDVGKTISEKYEEYQNWLNDNNSIS